MKAIKTKIARGEKIQSKKEDEQNKLLNTKRIRATNSENIESDGVFTETNETTLNKKRKIKILNLKMNKVVQKKKIVNDQIDFFQIKEHNFFEQIKLL